MADDHLCVPPQCGAQLGEAEPPAVADEDRPAQVRLDLLDVERDRRRPDPQTFRRPGEVPCLGDRQEGGEPAELHVLQYS
jgi:hypothetical protein